MPSVSKERVEICFVPSPVTDHRCRQGFDLSHTLNLLPHVYLFKLGWGFLRRTGMKAVRVSGMENIYESVPMSGQWAASWEQRHLQNSWRCWRLQASAGSSSCVCVDLLNLSFDFKKAENKSVFLCAWETNNTVCHLSQNGAPNTVDTLPSTGGDFYFFISLRKISLRIKVLSCLHPEKLFE